MNTWQHVFMLVRRPDRTAQWRNFGIFDTVAEINRSTHSEPLPATLEYEHGCSAGLVFPYPAIVGPSDVQHYSGLLLPWQAAGRVQHKDFRI